MTNTDGEIARIKAKFEKEMNAQEKMLNNKINKISQSVTSDISAVQIAQKDQKTYIDAKFDWVDD